MRVKNFTFKVKLEDMSDFDFESKLDIKLYPSVLQLKFIFIID